ncbi:MAG: T9SS type A sorting domain-containing protein [bacterium]|nr:T9SS type A sorting domain-containing protein [bacterium]
MGLVPTLAKEQNNFHNTTLTFITYPNPSTHNLTLQSNNNSAITSIKFYIITRKELVAPSSSPFSFDISEWPNGLFLMEVVVDGQVYTRMGSKVGR